MRLNARQLDILWRVALVAGAIYAIGTVAGAAYRARAPHIKGQGTSDFIAFHLTARYFLDTGRVTYDLGVKNYLPFFTILMVPLSVAPCWLGAGIITAMSIAGLVLSVSMVFHTLAPPHPAPPVIKIAVPVLMTLPFVHACLVLGQVSVLMGTLCLMTWWLFVQRRPWAAGLPLAIAILVKPFFATLILFFLLKRQWRTPLSTLAWTIILGGGLTFAAMGPKAWADAHRNYCQRVIRANTPLALIGADKPAYARFSNQSLCMTLRRLLTDTPAGDSRKPFKVNWAHWSQRVTQMVYVVFIVCLALITVFVGRLPLRRINAERACFEFGMFLLWGLISSPIIWTHYLPLTLYPLILLTLQLMMDADDRRQNVLGLFAWTFWIVAALSLVTEAFTLPYLRAVGVHLWATILLWAAMAVSASRIPPCRQIPDRLVVK